MLVESVEYRLMVNALMDLMRNEVPNRAQCFHLFLLSQQKESGLGHLVDSFYVSCMPMISARALASSVQSSEDQVVMQGRVNVIMLNAQK